MPVEVHTSLLAFFGRLGDQFTRRALRPEEMSVSLEEESPPALTKEDGHFAFHDLTPSATPYHIRIGGPSFLTRTLTATLPTAVPVQVILPGEDELYLALSAAPNAQNQVTFPTIDFVPPIVKGSAVFGPGGVTTTLAEPLEGRDVGLATLAGGAGLAPGDMLRIVRSPNLMLRPGPYYPFPAEVTVVALHVAENSPEVPAISGATLTIDQIDGNAPAVGTPGGLPLSRFALSAGPNTFVVLDDDDRATTSNDRGDAVFFFAGSTPLTSLRIEVAKPQYVTATVTSNVVPKMRTFQKILLSKA